MEFKIEYDEMDEHVLVSVTGKRKRRQSYISARSKAKEKRYSGKEKISRIACKHNSVSCAAVTLTDTDILHIKEQLYYTYDKVKQDEIILSHMEIMQCKRRRRSAVREEKRRQRDMTIKYTVLKEDDTRVPVCQASFLSIFCVKKDRVLGIAKYWFENGKARPENRGGSRQEEVTVKTEQDLKSPKTEENTEDGELTEGSWKWEDDVDEAVEDKPSISPPSLTASSETDAALTTSASGSPEPERKIKNFEDLIWEMEERQAEREREATEREERRWRQLEEREERRERERQEREDRREREAREREERRHQEAIEREEKRDREAKKREERFIRLLEIIANK